METPTVGQTLSQELPLCELVDYSHAVAGHQAHVDVNNKSVLASSVDKRRPLPIATVLCVLRDRQLQL